MFETPSKDQDPAYSWISTYHDIEGWVIRYTRYEKGYTGWHLDTHKPCNSYISYKQRNGEHVYYCKKCNIRMPHEVYTIVDTTMKAIKKKLPIP